ncbi:hypothetical protein CK226_15705 [Mesorhizobium sp. WSM4311]|nr:hypothetical protein CK226_15705 [Mesorhizobium sp. WSM4311]TRD09715.1 hypothetical protein FJV82_03255 [Mesorhizobium sp. WSM4305]
MKLASRQRPALCPGKPFHTFPGIAPALWFCRNSGRKTVSHFSWNCSRSDFCPGRGTRAP